MDSQGAGFAFDTTHMDFTNAFAPQQQASFMKPVEDNTSTGFFFGDEGIDTTTGFSQQFDTMNPALLSTPQQTSFDMQHSLAMDNTSASTSAWHTQLTPDLHNNLNTFPPTPVQSFNSLYQQPSALGKRPLQLDAQDFPQSKRHEAMGDFTLFPSLSSSATASSWALDAQPTPSSVEVGLSDEAADVCATWFNKYNVLPSDRHIESLSQLTGESADAIRSWFGRLLKQGMGSSDSAYKSQTNLIEPFWNDQYSTDVIQATPPQTLLQAEENTTPDAPSSHDTTTVSQPASTLRGSKKRCTPTADRQLLGRDPSKIYQCTRKCGKRYGRKCDWKRNEEEGYPCKSWVCSLCTSEGVENVKPCFRKYHFVQHFRNIHPEINAEEYEEASVVCSETEFPRKCGFCRHRFVSRQDRIDHIADHFKQGKCMLDWNEEDTDDSDGTDDNDDSDRPSDDGFDGSKPSHQPPSSYPPGGSGSQYYDGSDNNGSGGQPPHGGFFQFQLSQLNGGDSGSQPSCAGEHIKPTHNLQTSQQRPSPEEDSGQQSSTDSFRPSERSSLHGKHLPAVGDHKDAVAGDALSQSMTDRDPAEPGVPSDEKNALVVYHHQKRTRVSIGGLDATSPGDRLDLSQSSNTGCTSVMIATPTSTDRDPLHMPDDPHGSSSEALRLSTASNALTSGELKMPSSGVLPLESKLVSLHESKAVGRRLITHQVLHSIPTTSQAFLSVKLLGAGGFSTVDEVVHRETGLRVGRKTLKNRDHTATEELRKEVNVLQKLRHPHVIRFLGAYSKGDKMSILLSPVAETTLALWLERSALQKPANLAETIVKMFGCLASSVRYLHEQRPVVKHMDIKPQNILIVEGDQEFPHVVLSDFGISSSEELSDEQSKPLTRQYIAPEVFEGFTRKQAADIWSLGCVFAEMASVSFSQGNSGWLSFRREFSGRTGKYYWQDVPALQDRLATFLEEATTATEETVVRTLKTMLSFVPTERPDAASLTIIFTPAPCCLNWPNDKMIFPGPQEESGGLDMLVHEHGIDCRAHPHELGRISEGSGDDLSSAKCWLEDCSHSHEACRQQALSGIKALPTRLVDILPDGQIGSCVRVVDSTSFESSSDEIEYVALSHVWNHAQVLLSSDCLSDMQTELPLQALPEAVNAAISAARRLGYRYIWTDSLCVLQDNFEDKRQECATMASVFRNAALTVVLDQLTSDPVGPSRAPLVGTTARTSATEGRLPASATLPAIDFTTPGFDWDTRAWALQERLLSRRFLHLGEQMYWECNSLKASETFPRGLSPLVWEKVHSKTTEGVQVSLNERRASSAAMATGRSAHDKQPRGLAPSRLRDCQWIKKEGDGIGDSMQAAQTLLSFGDVQAPSRTPSHGYELRTLLLDHAKPDNCSQTVTALNQTRPASSMEAHSLSCDNCGTTFTGTYRKGNLARHTRLHHRNVSSGHAARCDMNANLLSGRRSTSTEDTTTDISSGARKFIDGVDSRNAQQDIVLSGQFKQNGSGVQLEGNAGVMDEEVGVKDDHTKPSGRRHVNAREMD